MGHPSRKTYQKALRIFAAMPILPSLLPPVVLASGSPRRQQLLRQIGAEFVVIIPDIEEIHREEETPGEFVRRLALEKARSVRHGRSDGVVLGSDTVVVLESAILGKPTDPADAQRMLRQLSGKTHIVFTGYALIDIARGREVVGHEETSVTFRSLEAEEINRYVATGHPLDKAGSYGIQDDFGAVFVERISGDYYTVVGLPLSRVYLELRRMAQDSMR